MFRSTTTSTTSSVVTGLTVVIATIFLVQSDYMGLFCLIPAFFADFVCSSCYNKPRMSSLAKVMILSQCLGIWWLMQALKDMAINDAKNNHVSGLQARTNNIISQFDGNAILSLNSKKHHKHNSAFANVTEIYGLFDFINSDSDIPPFVSSDAIIDVIGSSLPSVTFPDLKYRGSAEIRLKLRKIFEELPQEGFLQEYKNPCWFKPNIQETSRVCLPYAYILGQPKSGTSDLFERIKRHPQVRGPRRKEVRWFTRGEFTTNALPREGSFPKPYDDILQEGIDGLIGSESSIYSFTSSFNDATRSITHESSSDLVAIDGGPHTLWWPTQSPDGAVLKEDISATQMIREIQPSAKFIVTLNDPVKRMYSDYYFLDDNLRPVSRRTQNTKSAEEFHRRSEVQVQKFKDCVDSVRNQLRKELFENRNSKFENIKILNAEEESDQGPLWFRASQICAHDRHRFAVGGWGRISIGLYILFIEKWLEHFPLEQFIVVRLEDYVVDPKGYMQRIYSFLDLHREDEIDWDTVLSEQHFNENKIIKKEPVLEETETMLREFYKPYNELLSKLLRNSSFLWDSNSETLRQEQSRHISSETQIPSDSTDNIKLQLRKRYDVTLVAKAEEKPAESKIGINHHSAEDRFHLVDSSIDLPQATNPTIENDDKELNKGSINFTLEGLPLPVSSEYGTFMSEHKLGFPDENKLCFAAFSMDLAALKDLLYDSHVSPNFNLQGDSKRSSLHCLAVTYIMSEAHSRSHIFAMLKGKETWFSSLLEPVLPIKLQSIHVFDIIESIADATAKAASWLLKAGADVYMKDARGHTFLHLCSVGGNYALVQYVLEGYKTLWHSEMTESEKSKLINMKNADGRTAVHFAASLGHAQLLGLFVKHGGDLTITDNWGVSAKEIVENPGPISASDAMKYLDITQRPVRSLNNRRNLFEADQNTWKLGNGGWGEERLKGFENDYDCEIDQFLASEITDQEIFDNYLARNAPVLIRGFLDSSFDTAREWYALQNLSSKFGTINVDVSDVPYSDKFGGAGKISMTLNEYIQEVRDHRLVGGTHPWYVFKGHPIPSLSDRASDSLVPYHIIPTPRSLFNAFSKISPPPNKYISEVGSRELFINAQWALGGEGTGAPIHFHNSAWSALIYGAKKWFIYPPHDMIMSNMQILAYVETDYVNFTKRGIVPKSCVQLAGDVMLIPESWGHGVLNIEESIAVASELKESHWRIKPGSRIVAHLPFDNRNDIRENKKL